MQADGPRAGQVALDGGRRGGPQPHRGQRAGQGREGAGRARRRLPQAAVVAALLQRLQESALPLLQEVALRVLGGQGAGARRRRAARVQDRRRPGRGRVRVRDGADQVRRGPGAVAPADSAGQGRAGRRLAVDHIPVDIARLRRDVRPRPAQEVRLQAQVALGASEADGARRGALLRRLHGASRGGARPRLRDGHRDRAQVRPPVPAHIVPEGVPVPARAADARQDGGGRAGAARRAREGGAEGVLEAVPPGPDRQRGGVRRQRGASSARRSTRRPGGARSTTATSASPSRRAAASAATSRSARSCPRAAASASTGSAGGTAPR